jgi:hypothetical protein
MAFTYKLTLGKGFPSGQQLFFESWCEDAWDELHNEPVKIAVAKARDSKGYIMTNGACIPMTKGSLSRGDEITSETVIGVAAAEGENIPYGKPYCVFQASNETD